MFFTSIKWECSRYFLLLALLIPLCLQGQIVQSGRLEIPLIGGFPSYQVASAQHYGLIMYRGIDTPDGPKIELSRIDTAMQEVWHGFINTDRKLALLYAQVHGNTFSLLLKGASYAIGDFLILNVGIEKGAYSTYHVKNAIPFSPTQFTVTPSAALIGGYFNYRPLIVHFNFTTQQSKVLPGFFNEPGELDQMTITPEGGIDVIVCAKNFENKKCLWIRNYDAEGNLNKTVIVTPDDRKSFIFGRSVQSSQGNQIVCGVYGRYAEYSRGVFVAVINDVGEYTTRYYSFAELHNFFKYMKASREKRILNRIQRRKIKGKKTRFNYRMMVNDLVPHNNQFVMLGEAFYPHYTYTNRGFSSGGYSRYAATPFTREGMVFDGYQYTHAVVIGFDDNGKLVWDNSFEVNDVRSMQLEQFVKIQTDKERIILLYLHKNLLRTKIIKDSEVIEGKSENQLFKKSASGSAKTNDIEMSKLDHWYDQYFFAYGVEAVKNNQGNRTGPGRKVFFINKITYK